MRITLSTARNGEMIPRAGSAKSGNRGERSAMSARPNGRVGQGNRAPRCSFRILASSFVDYLGIGACFGCHLGVLRSLDTGCLRLAVIEDSVPVEGNSESRSVP